MSRTRYHVAWLTGHGIGPEVMAQACRVADAASRLHGFAVDDVHVPFGAEAFMRFGHPFPPASRRATLEADAIVVPSESHDLLDTLELDVCASVARVRFDGSELSVLSPLRDEWGWTLERAFTLARESRARVTLVGVDDRWRGAAAAAEVRHDGLQVERITMREAVQWLVLGPERFDVLVCPPEHATTCADVAACRSRRTTAWGRIAQSGPSVFGPTHGAARDIAGQDVADPSSMLLAAALMLGEGLGERHAAATVSAAVGRAGRRVSTRALGDEVLEQLPLALANSEFYPEFAA
jgi:3-isopropylmalate dehydrogenase